MKKWINLIALVVLMSTNVLTPFSYAQEEIPEVNSENDVESFWEWTSETENNEQNFLKNFQKNELESEDTKVQELLNEIEAEDTDFKSIQWRQKQLELLEDVDVWEENKWQIFEDLKVGDLEIFSPDDSIYTSTDGCYTYKNVEWWIEIVSYSDSCSKFVDLSDGIDGYDVISIGDNAFRRKYITWLVLWDTVKTIGSWAFSDGYYGWRTLESVVLWNNIEYLWFYAFWYLWWKNIVQFPEWFNYNNLQVENQTWNWLSIQYKSWFFVKSDDGCFSFDVWDRSIYRYNCEETYLSIPEKIQWFTVKAIMWSQWWWCWLSPAINPKTVKKIELPSGVERIGNGAGCSYEWLIWTCSLWEETELLNQHNLKSLSFLWHWGSIWIKPYSWQTLSDEITDEMLSAACMYRLEQHTVNFYDENGEFIKEIIVEWTISDSDFPSVTPKEWNKYLWVDQYGKAYDGEVVTKNLILKLKSIKYGISYEDGYIELIYGDETVYIKDINQWAEISLRELYDKYRANENVDIEEDEDYSKTFWKFYYRWNNTWASRDELWVDKSDPRDVRANVSQQAIARWFDGWHLWESEWTGWIDWNTPDNPCNADKWEYLPTVNDWKKAMEIWSEIKGYDLDIQDYNDYGDIYYDPEFMDDILVPNAGYIKYNKGLAYNEQDKTDKMNLLALLFASPVMAEYQGYRQYISYIQNGHPYLWSAVDSGHKFWSFDERNNQYNYGDIDINEYDYETNKIAAPVRCFIDPDYVNWVEKYAVIFDTKWWNETVPAQTVKEWKKLKEPDIPTRAWYTFDGWYTSDWIKWNFDTDTVQSDIMLYAKWRLCGEGFVVENNKCIPEWMELNWVIKVTDGSGTMYIRDRNVGVSDDAVMYLKLSNVYSPWNYWNCEYEDPDYYEDCIRENEMQLNEINNALKTDYTDLNEVNEFYLELTEKLLAWAITSKELEAFKLKNKVNDLYNECSRSENEECLYNKMLEYVNYMFKQDFNNVSDASAYIEEYFWEKILNKELREYYSIAYSEAYWNFYYRWNNDIWLNYKDWELQSMYNWDIITNIDSLITNWIDVWNIWKEAWSGWIEWSTNNPCDASKWEYLPTISDWIKFITIRWNKNGHEIMHEYYENEDYYYINMTSDERRQFHSDFLFPEAGMVSSYNPYGRPGEYEMDYDYEWWVKLWTAQDKQGNLWSSIGDGIVYISVDYMQDNDDFIHGINSTAMPVRCFVNPAGIPDVYVVSYETNGWNNDIPDVNVIAWDTVILPTPTKANYIFGWWYTDETLTKVFTSSTPVTWDLTLYAKWIQNQSGGHSSWWGWKRVVKTDTKEHNVADSDSLLIKERDHSVAEYMKDNTKDSSVIASEWQTQTQNNQFNSNYTDEMNQAYAFSKLHWITTKSTIQEAEMNSPLTRIQMAKMLSQYAMNVMWKKPDVSRWTVKFNDVTNKLDRQYDNWVTLAYQLWIMWQNMKNNKFRPYDEVTRAEFVTALSRMLYWTFDWEYKSTSKYYIHHMEKLIKEWIINKTDPKMKEKRWYVMLMLMRSAK